MRTIDDLLNGVEIVYWTDCIGYREKHYKVHSKLNPELWDKIVSIWGREWAVWMRDVVVGNDNELSGCYATVPEKTWRDMVSRMKERLFIVRVGFRHYSGCVVSHFWKEWAGTRQEVVDQLDTERDDIVDWEVVEAENTRRTREYMTAEEIYNELNS